MSHPTMCFRNSAGQPFYCSICGRRFDPGQAVLCPKHRWRQELRAVYCPNRRWSEVRLSGVGCRHVGLANTTIPVDRDQIFRVESGFINSAASTAVVDQIREPVPYYQGDDIYVGFMFHETCFKLFRQALQRDPSDNDCRLLMDILRSFQDSHMSGFDPYERWNQYLIGRSRPCHWGHDPQRALQFPKSPEVLKSPEQSKPRRRPYVDDLELKDPLNIDKLNRAIMKNLKNSLRINQSISTIQYQPRSAYDIFARFPVELREMVFENLPSRDLCNLRLASRAVATTSLTPYFWRSRFMYGHEFDFVFEVAEYEGKGTDKGQILDVRGVYQYLKGCKELNDPVASGLGNRRRIWNATLRPTVDLITLLSDVELAGEPCETMWERKDQNSALLTHTEHWKHWKWSTIPQDGTHVTLKPLYIRQITLPHQPIVDMFISVVTCLLDPYVSGLRLRFRDGSSKSIGYILPGHEVHLPASKHWYPWMWTTVSRLSATPSASFLNGFATVTRKHGIHAISPLWQVEDMYVKGDFRLCPERHRQWAGDPEGWIEEELDKSCFTGGDPVMTIKVALDGFKMISIGVKSGQYWPPETVTSIDQFNGPTLPS